MRAVLDTVVFVRALINPRGRWGRLLFELSDRYVIVLSPEIIKEILEVLYRSSLRQKFPQIDEVSVDQVLAVIENAEVVESDAELSVCRDASDNKFFEAALAGAAEYIVSEDRDILDITEYSGIKTIAAYEFLKLISSL